MWVYCNNFINVEEKETQQENTMNDRWANRNNNSNNATTNNATPTNATWEKTYIGNGKENEHSKFEEYNVSICMQDVPDSAFVDAKNGKTYLNFRINPKKEVGQYGDTHNVYVSTKEVK